VRTDAVNGAVGGTSKRRDIIQADCRLVGSYSGLVDFGIVHGAHADVDDDGACVPLVPLVPCCSRRAAISSRRPVIGFTAQLERQAGDDEGREEDRQKTLPGASEGDGLAFGGLECPGSAGVSATADLQGVTSRFDWDLDCVVHVDRSGTLTVNDDVVHATSDLGAD